ncbi:vacuolar protein sorting-associated protein VTA1 homolog isoform X2 [Scophthalmus maximus]|uniref:vacuolar protein sorting-associated protein VTA1 homolog isoform X2 n=1 Tax=Scophthalmus maximus TaxID=52904 RepID=UPI0015E140F8|nr:vacuolar protein sorting-associated protein VTA1 homolog isoform X2 [Scophthalmus maximus]
MAALPAQLRSIQHHLRTAQEHERRDPVVAYYCRLYAMQTGMKLDSKTPECRKFLIKLMDQLELMKKDLGDNDSISQEVVGNAHIENYALKMFLYADNEDRAGRFHKNMIKSFYTASLLLDVVSVFGELSEENIQHRKYARWKATYIHNCLKNGETPQAGPIAMEGEEDGEADEFGAAGFSGHGGSFRAGAPSESYEDQDKSLYPGPAPGIGFTPSPGSGPSGPPSTNYNNIHIPPGAHAPANTPAELPPPAEGVKPVPLPRSGPTVDPSLLNAQQQGGVHLTAEDFTKAQKLCKYAGSALQYEDVGTAIQNLQKALTLLTTGKE